MSVVAAVCRGPGISRATGPASPGPLWELLSHGWLEESETATLSGWEEEGGRREWQRKALAGHKHDNGIAEKACENWLVLRYR